MLSLLHIYKIKVLMEEQLFNDIDSTTTTTLQGFILIKDKKKYITINASSAKTTKRESEALTWNHSPFVS